MRPRRPRNPVPSRWRDPLVAAAWLVALEAENLGVAHRHRSVLAYGLVVGALGVAAFFRRRAPLAFVVVALIATTVFVVVWGDATLYISPLYLLAFVPYTIATQCSGGRALLVLATVLAWQITVDLATAANATGSIAGLLTTGASWGAGRWLQARRMLDAQLKRRAEAIEVERSSRARLAVAVERTRIARELHALIAAKISAMVVQAEAAELLLDRDPVAAEAAMAVVERNGRYALADMRRMLGVLRHHDDSSSLTPQPGVGDIYRLVEAARSHGQTIELTVDGEPAPLPASVDLGIYRMLEEMLNAQVLDRGAVRVRFGDGEVDLEVRAGPETSLPWPTAAMSERAALCGATIHREDGPHNRLSVTFPKRPQEVLA
jgi:signal transduction histidine kinase